MERLKDPNSTNLYMEGLPLSIDEPTLQALVNPYRIMSSRFFRTRLSNPPRIIAFVRYGYLICRRLVFDASIPLDWRAVRRLRRSLSVFTGGWSVDGVMREAEYPFALRTPVSKESFE